jgi:hypothetical protein
LLAATDRSLLGRGPFSVSELQEHPCVQSQFVCPADFPLEPGM